MMQLRKTKIISILLFVCSFIMMKTNPHFLNRWMVIIGQNIVIFIMFIGGTIFFIIGLLFTTAIITRKETKSSYATVNLPWYKVKMLMPGWLGNTMGAITFLSAGSFMLYMWFKWDIIY